MCCDLGISIRTVSDLEKLYWKFDDERMFTFENTIYAILSDFMISRFIIVFETDLPEYTVIVLCKYYDIAVVFRS